VHLWDEGGLLVARELMKRRMSGLRHEQVLLWRRLSLWIVHPLASDIIALSLRKHRGLRRVVILRRRRANESLVGHALGLETCLLLGQSR
jgi:hypothetical protein